MQQNYFCMILVVMFGAVMVTGCAKQDGAPQTTEEKITNQCIDEINVFENYFGFSRENMTLVRSNCSVCRPWSGGFPQVATFSAVIEKDSNNYEFFFSDNCPRHEQTILNYSITSEENTTLYAQMKQYICARYTPAYFANFDFNVGRTFLSECQEKDSLEGDKHVFSLEIPKDIDIFKKSYLRNS